MGSVTVEKFTATVIAEEATPDPEPLASPGASDGGGAPGEEHAEGEEAQAVVPKQGLVKAAWEGKLREVRSLLRQRADPNHFEAHMGGATRITPLMAASAGGRLDVVAELLVAGADPDLPSSAGVVAGELADNNKIGRKIGQLLGAFRVEIEESVVAAMSAASPAGGSPHDDSSDDDEGKPLAASVSASSLRRDAIEKVRRRGVALVERALLGYSRSFAVIRDGSFEDDGIALAGSSALEGDAARQARKERQQELEAARLRRVAERAAARRGVDDEAERLKRVAEKAAARRGVDPEEERLKRVAEKAAARRERAAEQEQAKKDKEEAKLKRLAEKAADRASIKKLRSQVEEEVQKEHLAEIRQVPCKRKVVEGEATLCANCGTSCVRQRCGKCERNGMCTACSRCSLCGTITGFANKVALVHVPGMRSL